LINQHTMWVKSLTLFFAVSLLLLKVTQAQDSWSWGTDSSDDSDTADKEAPASAATTAVEAPQDVQGRDGRFLGITDKLCELGLGVHCKKKPHEQTVQSHYQVKPHPPKPAYQAPYDTIRPSYVAPKPQYPAPKPLYPAPKPPKPAYTAPKPGYTAPYDTIKTQYVAPQNQQPAVVQHVHSHTHIHQTAGAQPVAPAVVAPVVTPVYQKAYREQCECVTPQYCRSQDIIARNPRNPKDISHLLDPRSEIKEGIVSNATSSQGRANFKEGTPESTATTEEKVERTKRETFTPGQNRTYNIEGRQFTSYIPTHNGCTVGHICCRKPVYIPPTPKYTCGRSSSSGLLGRVKTPHYLQGDAEFAEYPWQAAILRDAGHETVYVCGAALIDEKHVLTAAHCVDGLNPYTLTVRLGEWDVTQSSEFFSHLEVQVASVIEHQEFYKGNLQNDISILRLASHVDFNANPHISPVCLPNQYSDFRGQQCQVTGWGKDNFGSNGKFQSVLKEVTVPIQDHYGCQNTLRQTRLGRSFNLDPGMLCAGGEEDKDACKGDGGGPLVCKSRDGSYQLAGLVSWGIGCGQRGIPGVYVNVKNYLQWIENNTAL